MSRAKFNENLPAVAADAAPRDQYGPLPCSFCGDLTSRSVLAHLGARCSRCYEAYCRAPQRKVNVGDKRQSPRAWAHALKRREEAGERLTPPQRAMWRAAIGRQDAQPQDAEDADYATRERRQAEQERIRQYAAERGLPLATGG